MGYALTELQHRGEHTFAWEQRRLYVHQVGVHPSWRRLGIGRALMLRAEALAVELSADEVALDTWAFNESARRFFEALGYSVYNFRMRKP